MNRFSIVRGESHSHGAIAVLCVEDNCPKLPSKAFSGKFLESSLVYGDTTTLYVGVGKEAELNPLKIKELGAKISKAFHAEKIYRFAVDLSALDFCADYYRNLPQGVVLGAYEFNLKSKPEDTPVWEVTLLGTTTHAKEEADLLAEGLHIVWGVQFARDLINAPANHLRPADFAQKATELLTGVGVECETISGDALKKMGMNGLYSIGNSSEFPPQFLIMHYNSGSKGDPKTALVGKGLTYDTGGYSLKPSASMETMEGDMGGGAAVVGALYALATNKVATNVVGLVALAENRISSGSLVPGDIYTAYDGQTVQVLNTDAEGRLVLADAVAYAVKDEKAAQIIDIATLTGAAVVALGHGATPVVTNNDNLLNELLEASKASGERYWNFPTFPEYQKMIDTPMADVKNIGGREGGVITGGLFIGRFVGDTPWIHLDIAGTSWHTAPLFEHQGKGGTGTAVDTLYYFCKNKASK